MDVNLPHLDRLFDYRVPEAMQAGAQPGARVRVRFAGRLVNGYVIERVPDSTRGGPLSALQRVVSPEVVLTSAVADLVRRVADHYCGTFADVVRLAVPPRHGVTESAEPRPRPMPKEFDGVNPLAAYPRGDAFCAALGVGQSPRAAWNLAPVAQVRGDWATGLVAAADATMASGRGAILIVPDAAELARLDAACAASFGAGSYAVLSADQGPAARYRQFLAVSRGQVRLVIGTRGAAFAPVRNLGLIAVFDDGCDLLAEQRAPYPHARDVAALRCAGERCGLLLASYARSCEQQRWIASGWIVPVAATPGQVRRVAPVVRVAAAAREALERDPNARVARLPHDVFGVVRAGLAGGPVLFQVPRAGYAGALVCAACREAARCPTCTGQLRGAASGEAAWVPKCANCGWTSSSWRCPECGGRHVRAPGVGVERTAEEIGRAFPNTPVVVSHGDKPIRQVGPDPALVVATPGAEPTAEHGYQAAVLMDAEAMLGRPDLRSGEEALRRWFSATALVRSADEDGTVILVGPPGARPVQALVRLDPEGFATRELADRAEAGLPPAVRMVVVEGDEAAVDSVAAELREPVGCVVERPAPERLLLRGSGAAATALIEAVRQAVAARTARKEDGGAVRVRVDPVAIG